MKLQEAYLTLFSSYSKAATHLCRTWHTSCDKTCSWSYPWYNIPDTSTSCSNTLPCHHDRCHSPSLPWSTFYRSDDRVSLCCGTRTCPLRRKTRSHRSRIRRHSHVWTDLSLRLTEGLNLRKIWILIRLLFCPPISKTVIIKKYGLINHM